MPRSGRVPRLRALAVALVLAAVACGPPVNVRRVDPHTVTAQLSRSALNSDGPSLFSQNVLYRWNLARQFEDDPAGALATLHQKVASDTGSRSALFALAELCFLHAEESGARDYHLASAVFAWTFLFPGGGDERLDELDPRARMAADLYNRGITRAFAERRSGVVLLRSGLFRLPFGQQLAVRLDPAGLTWANRQLEDFVPVAELEVTGLGARFREAGIGAPLAASPREVGSGAQEYDYVASLMKVPATALLRIDDARAQLADPVIDASLQVFNAYETRGIEIDGQSVPLEVEPSAALAYSLSRSRVWGWELWGFLLGDLLGQEKIAKPLAFVEPYRPGRIPVVFVHGTASSPGRWADMLNVLSNTAALRNRYQFWFFFYETGNPIPYSAMKLRESLTEAVGRLDPAGTDPALREMVLIGHSQGGLLTKLTAVDTGSKLWDAFSRQPLEEVNVSPATRDLLRRTMFVEPLPFVREVIFISTPHRGSYVAGWSISRFVSRFVRLPRDVIGAATDLALGNFAGVRFDPKRPSLGSVTNMTPGNPGIQALAAIPIADGVRAHSIIPVKGDLPPDGQSDGVVKFESAHIEGVASELVVPRSGHSVQSNPLAIEEVRRILIEHADRVCEASHVACPPDRASAPTVAPPLAPRAPGRRARPGAAPRRR